jgi:amino acid adenylation domain-containing protein
MADVKESENYLREAAAAASHFTKERDYWLNKFAGELVKSRFPYDFKRGDVGHRSPGEIRFAFHPDLSLRMVKLSNASDPNLHMIMLAGITALLGKYSGIDDIIVGIPIYKQEREGEFTNTVLAIRNQLDAGMTFKEFLSRVRKTIFEAVENQSYPIEKLVDKLNLSFSGNGDFPLFEVVVLLENIHDRRCIQHVQPTVVFAFAREGRAVEGIVEYKSSLYQPTTIERICRHLSRLLENALHDIDLPLSAVEILVDEERAQLLFDFNNTEAEFPRHVTIHGLFERQVERTPDNTAVVGPDGIRSLSYKELNVKANQLCRLLRGRGVTGESVVGIMVGRSIDMVVGLLAILKAGGAYLPIEPTFPRGRILFMLADAGVRVLLSQRDCLQEVSFTALRNLDARQDIHVIVTPPRRPIEEFDKLPRPDRSFINLRNYQGKIGMASVTDCISLQATRGCPYECLFCHKIWSKNHVYRSPENIFEEVNHYYKNGVKNFAFIDDCFNLNREKSSRLFELIIRNRLAVQLFFPNGLRGDIMTADYIDLMKEAGTRGINLSLETASSRLQKLIKKNLDLEKFKEVVDYIARRHPEVILELATMHGLPTETQEEAMMTLDFIKGVRWLHFPYIHILKIFPNTEMEAFALEQGIAKEDIMISRDRAFHELPETLPFPKSFTRRYQADFMNNYFLNRERLSQVLPRQMRILSEAALGQKYNAYLPVEIKSLADIVDFTGLDDFEAPAVDAQAGEEGETIFDREMEIGEIKLEAKRILFLDLSQHFSSQAMLYRVVEQPLGLIYLLTYLKAVFGDQIDGRIYKSGNDFDSFEDLKLLVEDYKPNLIGIRTLTFFREFFHETVSGLRQWGVKVPIIGGGPYASSDYDSILKDKNVDLVVLGEGEYTLARLLEEMLKNDFTLPEPGTLERIRGIAYARRGARTGYLREVLFMEDLPGNPPGEMCRNPQAGTEGSSLAYVMYTSGSTGKPKGVMVEHRHVNNCIFWMQGKFNLKGGNIVVQRTNLTFDPSVWEIFWPLYVGGGVRILDGHQSKDAEFLIRLLSKDSGLTMMYCPSTMVMAMTSLLNRSSDRLKLKLPWLVIGAEPISMETVKEFYPYLEGKIVNTYGPTECTINNTYYDLEEEDRRAVVPIGRPVANNRVYILSNDLRPVPVKVVGEICIAGESVSRGYINRCQRTMECFIDNPFGKGKLYKTGDLGRFQEDGTIEIMGRIDEQVKIRGYRIEPGEIENALLKHRAVNNCIVLVRDGQEYKKASGSCERCGITSRYPGVRIDDDGVCDICSNFNSFKESVDRYFLTPPDLERLIRSENQDKPGKYDCLLVYGGGRGAAYALYRLVDMGFNVLVATYDHGYFGKADIENIKMTAAALNVDHVVLNHRNTDRILKESLESAATVCRGCFHTSSSLAGEYAYKNGIRVVVGATLSRGQIIENRLLMFLQQGVTQVDKLEQEIAHMQKITPNIDRKIFDLIDIDVIDNGAVHERVKFLDFYRYCNITNQEMIAHLNQRSPYWKSRKTYAIYSTNCPIKQFGDYCHLQERGYHYYGAATSWEKRLGHLSMENVKEDLHCRVTQKGYENFLKRIGVRRKELRKEDDKYLCAYITAERELTLTELRDYLSGKLPDYMIPSYFVQLEKIPLLSNGKVDRRALPEPSRSRSRLKSTFVEPQTDLEKRIAETWKEVLHLERIGTQDNFFDLGGTSLDIIQLGSKLRDVVETDIPVVTLFTYPTIRSLAGHFDQARGLQDMSRKRERQTRQLNKARTRIRRTVTRVKSG